METLMFQILFQCVWKWMVFFLSLVIVTMLWYLLRDNIRR